MSITLEPAIRGLDSGAKYDPRLILAGDPAANGWLRNLIAKVSVGDRTIASVEL